MQGRELVFPRRNDGERYRVKRARSTTFGNDISVGQSRCMSFDDSANRRGVIRRRSSHHFDGITAGKFNFWRLWVSHGSAYKVLKPKDQSIDEALKETATINIVEHQKGCFKKHFTIALDRDNTNLVTTLERCL